MENRIAGTGLLPDEYPVSKIPDEHITETFSCVILPVCVLLNLTSSKEQFCIVRTQRHFTRKIIETP